MKAQKLLFWPALTPTLTPTLLPLPLLQPLLPSRVQNPILPHLNSHIRGFAKGWFPQGGFGQMFPCTEISSKVFPCSAALAEKKTMIFDIPESWICKTGTRAQCRKSLENVSWGLRPWDPKKSPKSLGDNLGESPESLRKVSGECFWTVPESLRKVSGECFGLSPRLFKDFAWGSTDLVFRIRQNKIAGASVWGPMAGGPRRHFKQQPEGLLTEGPSKRVILIMVGLSMTEATITRESL